MSSFITAFLSIAFCIATVIQAVSFTPCSEGSPPINVQVDGCNKDTCTYKTGTVKTLTMDFKTVSNVNALYATIILKDDKETLMYNIGNALNGTNPRCTKISNDISRFQYTSPIQPPLGNFSSTIYLTDDANVVRVCFNYKANVVDS